jgi:hypothetical protein
MGAFAGSLSHPAHALITCEMATIASQKAALHFVKDLIEIKS